MQQDLSKLFILVAFGACAAEPSAVRPGSGSGSANMGSDMGSGSDVSMGSGGSAQPPPLGTLYGSVLDERGDQIDFSTGEPVHTHAGPAIDLGAGGCPAVYKYAYLEDLNDPVFGRQTAINPLEWHVMSQVGSLDDAASAYRVRLDDGTIVLDWTPATPDDTGLYTVRLYRNLVSAIGDHTGKMFVDVRFKDTAGNETVDSACWENHPMAAPLEVTALAQDDLFGWTLPAHSPISTAINTASLDGAAEEQVGATVFTQNIVQHTAEPVTVHLDHAPITATATDTVVQLEIETLTRAETAPCEAIDPSICAGLPAAAAPITLKQPLSATWDERIVDVATGALVCHNPDAPGGGSEAIDRCVLPARGANDAPHPYQIIYAMSNATSIAPTPGAAASELSITSNLHRQFHVTGTSTTIRWCSSTDGSTCSEQATGASVMSLDKAHIDFNPLQIELLTAPDANAQLEQVGRYATASLQLGPTSWDAGDAGLAP